MTAAFSARQGRIRPARAGIGVTVVVMAGGFLGGLRAERFSKRGAAWEASSGRRDLEAPSLDSDLTATAATASQTMVAMVVSAREPG